MTKSWYCIYRIINKVNGHSYIGQHKYEDETNPMGNYKGSGVLLHRAYRKYGYNNFEVEILYRRILNKSTVDAMEIWAIKKYKPEYNIAKGGGGGDTFSGHDETWKTIRRAQMSKWLHDNNPMHDEELKSKCIANMKSTINDPNYVSPCKGKPHSEEHNSKVSKALKSYYSEHTHHAKGKKFSQEHAERISNSRKGYKWFNDGVKSIQAKECPEGFTPGLGPDIRNKLKGRVAWNKGLKRTNKGENNGD